MKHSELKQIIKEEVRSILKEQETIGYSDKIAKQIVDKNLDKGKSEEELYDIIFDLVLADTGNNIKTQGIVWRNEDFIPDVLAGIDYYRNLNESDYDQAMQNLATKADITLHTSSGGNKFRTIFLPDVKGGITSNKIDTVEKFKQWVNDFKAEYGEEPKFEKSSIEGRLLVTNPKYLENSEMYSKGVSGIGTKGD